MDLRQRTKDILNYTANQIQNSEKLQSEFYSVLNLNGIESNKRCLSCVPGKLEKLRRKSISNFNNTTMKNRRYHLPEGKTIRVFGTGTVLNNDNLTDKVVEDLIKKNAGYKKVFIDSEADEEDSSSESELSKLTVAKLKGLYEEVTGQAPEGKPTKAELIEMIEAEQAAKAALEGGGDLDED